MISSSSRFAVIQGWDFTMGLERHLVVFVKWCFSLDHHHFFCLGAASQTTNPGRLISPYCHSLKFSSSSALWEWQWTSQVGCHREGVWPSDRSVGGRWQVRRCKAKQDDELINPATPTVQRETPLSQPQRLCSRGGSLEDYSSVIGGLLLIFDIFHLFNVNFVFTLMHHN